MQSVDFSALTPEQIVRATVVWHEPGETGDVRMEISAREAIAWNKVIYSLRNDTLFRAQLTDAEHLEEFCIVHWAQLFLQESSDAKR